jgi:hypothetical protein
MKKIFRVGILFGFLTMFMLSSKVALSQQMNVNQKYGACAGYHQFWALLSMRSERYSDQKFSESVVSQLNAAYGSNADYTNMRSRSLQVLTQAMQENNPTMVRSTAGFCAELNLPIGRNTKQ